MAPVRTASTRRGHRLRPTFVHSPGGALPPTRRAWDRGALDASFVRRRPGRRSSTAPAASTPAPLEAAVAALAGRLAGRRACGAGTSWAGSCPTVPPARPALPGLLAPGGRRRPPAPPPGRRRGRRPPSTRSARSLVLATAGMPAAELARGARPQRRTAPKRCWTLSVPGRPSAAGSIAGSPHRRRRRACSPRDRPACPKRRCTPTAAWATRPPSWSPCTGSDRGDAVLMPAPLAHVSGLLNGVLIPAAAGIPTRPHGGVGPRRGSAAHRGGARHRSWAPHRSSSPRWRRRPASAASGWRSLRLVSTGGASVSPAFVDATSESFGCRVKRTYGSTEAPTVTTSGPDDSIERARDTDGRALGEVEIEVHDPDTVGTPRARARPASCGCGAPSCSPATPTPHATARVVAGAGALVPHRRPRRPRRGGLAPGGGPALRHHHPGRREHLGVGGRGRPRGPPRRPPRRGRGRARSRGGRAGGRLRGGRRRPSTWPPAGPGSPSAA